MAQALYYPLEQISDGLTLYTSRSGFKTLKCNVEHENVSLDAFVITYKGREEVVVFVVVHL